MNKGKQLLKNIGIWLFIVFDLILMLDSSSTFASLLFVIIAILALPLKPIQKLWKNFRKQKTAILSIAFVLSISITIASSEPNTEISTSTSGQSISSELSPSESNKLSSSISSLETSSDSIRQSENIASDKLQIAAAKSDISSKTKSSDSSAKSTASSKTENSDSSAKSTASSKTKSSDTLANASSYSLSEIPAYSGDPYIALNDNVPFFTTEELSTTSFESYGSLDSLGRCSTAYANIGVDLMPTEKRGSIGQVKPTGWHTVKYDIIEDKYLYNRCHLIGYQLSGENANTQNLITGTRYLNIQGMLPFENMVADYVKETNHHVLYRVTPLFDGDNLVASGVIMEAESVEDQGDGILFCVYCYNVQPGITINYATGDSQLDPTANSDTASTKTTKRSTAKSSTSTQNASKASSQSASQSSTQDSSQSASQTSQSVSSDSSATQSKEQTYVLNTNTHKFHTSGCYSASQISDKNRQEYTGNREDLISKGYAPCKKCNP